MGINKALILLYQDQIQSTEPPHQDKIFHIYQITLLRKSRHKLSKEEMSSVTTTTVFPGIANFTTTDVKLIYKTDDDLTGTHPYKGVIGKMTFKLTLDNGVIMEGKLNEPGVVPAASVNGNGAWVKN
ncbi:hypothetical protein F5Y02DRAFT_418174 [Annulohypoxylon stygium]|nr:hypothetical protein F5Y02DRAFT_418174 [Annulohypoxylon stygium]